MYIKKEIGKIGEDLATSYLIKEKYKIIQRNFICRQGEIDIIAHDTIKKELVFIEVKTRTNNKYENPSESVNESKQKHIYKSAEYFVYKNRLEKMQIRFDIIEININILKKIYKINHIDNAFIKTNITSKKK